MLRFRRNTAAHAAVYGYAHASFAKRKQPGRAAGLAIVGLLVAGLIEIPFLMAPWFAQRNEKKSYTNHREQIAAMLQARGISVTADDVFTEQGWPDRINHQTYGANLTVQMPDGVRTLGRIECRDAKKRCWFELSHIDIKRTELDDLVKPGAQKPPVLTWQESMRTRLSVLISIIGSFKPIP